ncbi:hypothetical protein AX15_006200 [Amanita polypyramis BW_CC]|nr:hypothetical protein AX15_006200 [Amanita polypyramis BW_CC]
MPLRYLTYLFRLIHPDWHFQLDSLPWLMSEFAAANTASMILFVGNPTNVVICEGFGIDNAGFTGWTFFPFAACSATCLIALYAQYRASGKLKPVLPEIERFDVRGAIEDLPGAIVGALLLGGCLITALVVSFLNVDVWKITLPFACAKALFDIAWDLYKATHQRPKINEPFTDDRGKCGEGDMSSTGVEPQGPVDTSSTYKAYNPMNPPSHRSGTYDSTDSSLQSTLKPKKQKLLSWISKPDTHHIMSCIKLYLPTMYGAFPRLPFALVPFAFSQFILIEALDRQGWIHIFSRWLIVATDMKMYPTLWIVGVMGVILCNISGTNIGATILLTKVVRAANLPFDSTRAAGVALAVASNIGAVSFVFSASLAGLLWKDIIDGQIRDRKDRKEKSITQWTFAKWNTIPLLVMMGVGLAVVSVEVHIKYR